ncbi:50S ribosomal protein L9 [Patescibacteria group bacterium]|nr:50S ribosomal protein L9 [Patescibacteria group bacterium]
MKVILLGKVPGLGNVDDVKDVADGYAKNFLFPKHLAVQASAKALNEIVAQKNRLAKEEEKDLHEAQSTASKLDGAELKFTEKVNNKGLLYSAVNAQKISEKLVSLGYSIDKKQIIVPQIKTIGEFSAKIRFRHGLETSIRVIVSAK